MKTILIVLGTRPEVIKLAPVILELKRYPQKYNVLVCNTEQQKELSNQTLSFFNLKADINLDAMLPNQTLAQIQSLLLQKLSNIYKKHAIDATIVQGDTMTVFCGALVSFYNKVPVFHVEAGLRSYNLHEPFPEEAVRQMTSRITDHHFAPTDASRLALMSENIPEKNIHVTGNTVIDSLFCLSDETLRIAEENLQKSGIDTNKKTVLVTVHRRENHGERLEYILEAVRELAEQHTATQFVLPVHPNPNVKDKVYAMLSAIDNVMIVPPLDYPELVCVMKRSALILTDSGGIQEEAPAFAVPVLVMRYETERQEGIDAGFAKLVGADKEKIILEAVKVLDTNCELNPLISKANPYGDGKASIRIQEIIDQVIL